MKKNSPILVFCLVAGMLLTGCGSGTKTETKKNEPVSNKQQYINIATGSTSGTYYPLGSAIAEILNKNIAGVNASIQTTGASVANINLLATGRVDVAFVQNDIAFYAVNGTELYKDKKVVNIKGLASLYPETIQIITLEKTGIKTLADIKGKRVAVGAAGSGTEANARQILEAYGIGYGDIKVQYLSFGEASSALKDGNVDLAFVTAGHPTAAIQEIANLEKMVLLPITQDKADIIIKKYPFYTKIVIGGNTYKNQTGEVPTVAVMAMLAVTDKMNADTGYKVARAIFTNTDKIKAVHTIGQKITKNTATSGMSIPLNEGADKFYKEK